MSNTGMINSDERTQVRYGVLHFLSCMCIVKWCRYVGENEQMQMRCASTVYTLHCIVNLVFGH